MVDLSFILQAAASAPANAPSALPVFDKVFVSLSASLGQYYALAAMAIAIMIAFDFARYALSAVTHILERREGVGVLDTFYYAAAHGEVEAGSIAIGIVCAGLGAVAVRMNSPPPQADGIIALLSLDPVKSAGALMLIAGLWFVYRFFKNAIKRVLFGAWYHERPEVKKMKTEMVTSFKKTKTLDVIEMFRSEITSLLAQFREADDMKFTFKTEEADITEVLGEFKMAEELSDEGKVKEADKRITNAKRKLESIKPKIADKLKRFQMVRETIASLNLMARTISDMHGECGKLGVDISAEKVAFSKLDVNKSLVVAENQWNKGDFVRALGELERLRQSFEKIRTDTSYKLSQQKALLARKFHCVRCGRMLDLAHTKCPDCGETSDLLLEEMKNLIDSLEKLSERFDETKWLISFEEEQKTIEKLSATIGEIAKQVEGKELDRAVSLLASVNSNRERLAGDISSKLEVYDSISAKMAEMKKRAVEINSLVSEGKKLGAIIADEVAEYEKVSEEASLKRIEDLCLRGSYNEANNRLDKAQTTYGALRATLIERIEVSKNINAKISDISELYSDVKGMVESAHKLNVDVSFEEREMRSIILEDLRKRALEKPGPETDSMMQKSGETIAKTKKSLGQKLSMYKSLSEKRDELAKAVDEIKALISKAVAMNIDVSAEHEKFFTIKLDKVNRMLSNFEDFTGLQNTMNDYMKIADFCSSSIREKLEVVDGGIKSWMATIEQTLNRNDKVSASSLVDIPERWRMWCMERYVSEHKEDYFVLQDGVLARLMRSDARKECDGVIGSVAKSGKISACLVMNPDGMQISSNLPKEVDAGRTAKALASAISELARSGRCGSISELIVKTASSKSLILSTDDYGYLVCVSRPTEDTQFLSIIASPASEKIASILAPKEI